MTKYRFKTEQEFKDEGNWHKNYPSGWNTIGEMNHFLGQEIPEEYNSYCDSNSDFKYEDWSFKENNYILINKVVPGKWYKVNKDAYRKALTVEKDHITYIEFINYDGYSMQASSSCCNDLSRFVLATQEELDKHLPDNHIDKTSNSSDKEFIVGKWYKYKNYYLKYLNHEKEFWRASEYISDNGRHHSIVSSFGMKQYDCEKILLEDLTEIQEYLPKGHLDKIVMKQNYVGRTIKALINNPECTGVLLGEEIKIIDINSSGNYYILDKNSKGYNDMHINISLKLSDWELLPETYNGINMDDIREQAKLKYPIGCSFFSADANIKNKLKSDFNTYTINTDSIWAHTGAGCLYNNGKWAEIIEEKPLADKFLKYIDTQFKGEVVKLISDTASSYYYIEKIDGSKHSPFKHLLIPSTLEEYLAQYPKKESNIPDYVKCINAYGNAKIGTVYSTNDEKLANKLFSLSWHQVLIVYNHLEKDFRPYYGDPVLAINYISGNDPYKAESDSTTSIKTKKENKTSIEFVQSVAVNLRTKNKSIKF